MAKIAFSKLNKIKSIPAKTITIADAEVSVAQYLPLEEKLNLIQTVIELSGNGEEGFYNVVKLKTHYIIEMIKTYTNISITEKQQEDIPKLYDIIMLNHIWEDVANVIPKEEQDYIWDNIVSLAREVTNFNHSALGILKIINTEHDNMELDAKGIQDAIKDPDNLKLLKEILTKLG